MLNLCADVVGLTAADLRSAGVYVAGFTDANCASQTDLYDLFVDCTSCVIRYQAKRISYLVLFRSEFSDVYDPGTCERYVVG